MKKHLNEFCSGLRIIIFICFLYSLLCLIIHKYSNFDLIGFLSFIVAFYAIYQNFIFYRKSLLKNNIRDVISELDKIETKIIIIVQKDKIKNTYKYLKFIQKKVESVGSLNANKLVISMSIISDVIKDKNRVLNMLKIIEDLEKSREEISNTLFDYYIEDFFSYENDKGKIEISNEDAEKIERLFIKIQEDSNNFYKLKKEFIDELYKQLDFDFRPKGK